MEALQTFGGSGDYSILDPFANSTTLPLVQHTRNDAVTIDSISDVDQFFYLDPYLRPYYEECGEKDPRYQDIWICNLGLQGHKHIPAIPAAYQLDSNSGRAVYVCGFPYHYTDKQFKNILSEYGTIVSCPMIIDTTSQETFRWAVMQTKAEAIQLQQMSSNQQSLNFKIVAHIALPPGRSLQLTHQGKDVGHRCRSPVGLSLNEPEKQFQTVHDHSIWQSNEYLPSISSYLKTHVPHPKHLSSISGYSELVPSKKRRVESTTILSNSHIRAAHLPSCEPPSTQNWPAKAAPVIHNSVPELHQAGFKHDFSSFVALPYILPNNSFGVGSPINNLQDSLIIPRPVQIHGNSASDAWYSTEMRPLWSDHISGHLRKSFESSTPDSLGKNRSSTVCEHDPSASSVNTCAQAVDAADRQTSSSNLESSPSASKFSSEFKTKSLANEEQDLAAPVSKSPLRNDFLKNVSSWARIASKASPESRIIDLHPATKIATGSRLKSVSRFPAAVSVRDHEPTTEQMRVVFLLDLPHTITVEDVSSAVREGPLRSIHFGIDEEKKSRYAAVVFQLARDAVTFTGALLKERANSRPDRFRFVVDVVRGEEPFPLDDILRAMGPPMYATRRLTLVKASFFFMFGERQLRLLCDKIVGEAAVQLIWIYNGGNATIVFADVGSAMVFKAELDKYAAAAGQPAGQSAMWSGLSTTYSKDPCIAPLELKTAMHD